MLNSEPVEASENNIEQWKSLGPMTIFDIVVKSEDDYMFDPYNVPGGIEYKENVVSGSFLFSGFFKTGTSIKHGICRRVLKNDNIYESIFLPVLFFVFES